MFWEEKIDLIAKKHGPQGFKNPFTVWPDILKSIEDTFIIKKQDECWEDNIKQKKELVTIEIKELYTTLSLLQNDINYWTVIVMGDYPAAKNYVYDCDLTALKELVKISNYNFYIIDKKYKWLTYFKRDGEKVIIFKSNISSSPFDEKQ